jgi:hypothetical protein
LAVKRRYYYPYPLMQPGDILCVDSSGIFQSITRAVTGGSVRRAFDHSISTHTAMAVPIGNQLFAGEMINSRRNPVQISSFEVKYQSKRERIMAIRRVPGLTDEDRAKIINDFAELLRRGTEYDYRGLLEFVDKRVKDNKKRLYCSEMAYVLTRKLATYNKSYEVKVSPQDLLTTPALETVWER